MIAMDLKVIWEISFVGFAGYVNCHKHGDPQCLFLELARKGGLAKGAHNEQVYGTSGIDRDGLGGGTASAEILAMMNYESKTPDQVVDFNTMGAGVLLEIYCRIPSAGGQGRKL